MPKTKHVPRFKKHRGMKLTVAQMLNVTPSLITMITTGKRRVSGRVAKTLSMLYGGSESYWRNIPPDELMPELVNRKTMMDAINQ